MRATVLVIAAVVATSTTAHAGSAAIVVPPVEVAMGVGAPISGGTAVQGPIVETLAGIHWASLAWHPTHIDIGIGYVGSSRGILSDYSGEAGRSFGMTAAGASVPVNRLRLDGGYLELGRTLAGSTRHWRTWISARGELLHGALNDQGFGALGGALRISSELYVSGFGGGGGAGGGGIVCGSLALGVYVEASHREIAPELGPNGFTTGIEVRVPLIVLGS